jgi:hypothetical protein
MVQASQTFPAILFQAGQNYLEFDSCEAASFACAAILQVPSWAGPASASAMGAKTTWVQNQKDSGKEKVTVG